MGKPCVKKAFDRFLRWLGFWSQMYFVIINIFIRKKKYIFPNRYCQNISNPFPIQWVHHMYLECRCTKYLYIVFTMYVLNVINFHTEKNVLNLQGYETHLRKYLFSNFTKCTKRSLENLCPTGICCRLLTSLLHLLSCQCLYPSQKSVH